MNVIFNELSHGDNKVIGQVAINPRHVTRVRPVKPVTESDGNQSAMLVTLIEDVNKQQTRVEGSFSNITALLDRAGGR